MSARPFPSVFPVLLSIVLLAAMLEAISDNAIKLHRVDGAEFVVPLDRLSKPDQSFVELLRERLSR